MTDVMHGVNPDGSLGPVIYLDGLSKSLRRTYIPDGQTQVQEEDWAVWTGSETPTHAEVFLGNDDPANPYPLTILLVLD